MLDIAVVLAYPPTLGTIESQVKLCFPRLWSSFGRRLLVDVALGQAKFAIAFAILDHEPLARSVPSL